MEAEKGMMEIRKRSERGLRGCLVEDNESV